MVCARKPKGVVACHSVITNKYILKCVIKGMSHMKTGMKLGMDDFDETIADLMTDGCNMGVKSLSQYLNQYKAADEISKDITKRLIALEERLAVDIRGFL